jgi:hypothetical protein
VTARDWMEQGTAKFLAAVAQGRTIQASEIPWPTREVAVHAVDLGAGVSFADPGQWPEHRAGARRGRPAVLRWRGGIARGLAHRTDDRPSDSRALAVTAHFAKESHR